MILDVLNDSFICECDSDTVIPYTILVNTTMPAGHKCFKLTFDFNINVSSVYVGLLTLSGVTASGYYGEINDLGYPCAHYGFSDCLDQVNPNYIDISFDNHGITQTAGVVCSGMLCSGTAYTKSAPYFLFDCAYTSLLYFKQSAHVSGVAHDNMFFRSEGQNNEVLGVGVTQSGTLSVMLYNGTSEELYDTGMSILPGDTWNLLSLRCSPKTKLRVGCNDEFVEINRPCTFLGGSSVTYLGGAPGIGYFNGVLSDFVWWPNYADNIFIEFAVFNPSIALNGQRRQINTNTTTSGFVFNLSTNYPDRIYLEFDFPTENEITGVSVYTHDDKYVLASGVDTLFCGTIVRGYTSTDYPISIYNNTDYETYAYVFAYDSNRYKALSVSNDVQNYYSNQINLPGDVPWCAGEFKSGINNDIIIDTPYTTWIESNLKIILHDNSRKCLWYLSKDDFGFYDLRTNNFYTRTYPYFVSETIGIYNTKNYWDFEVDGNCIYLIHYKNGVYEYNTVSDSWSLIHSIPECGNVCVSTSKNYIFYVYYYLSKSEVFRYDISSGVETSVCSFSTSSLKIESNRDVLFVFNGSTIFKYDVDTLNIIAVSQNIGLSNVLEIKDVCGYLSIITTSAVYSLAYSQDGWGVLLKVYDFSSSFSISTVSSCAQNIAFVKSNTVYLARLSHYRYMSTDINILNNYNNTISLLPTSTTGRYKIVWAWLDTEESVPDFYLISKFSMGETIIYGFSRDTAPTAGTMSVFMSFNFVTKKYVNLGSVVPNNLIDVENGCLVETHNAVYYINFTKEHYYKYVISEDTWYSFSSPKTYSSVSHCTVVSAVYDLNEKIYVAGQSSVGYLDKTYGDIIDRFYAFFGYIDTVASGTDIFHNMYYLPLIPVSGKQNNGSNLLSGGTSFTCDLNYNINNDYLFLALSKYTSRAQSYTHDMTILSPSGMYVYDSLDNLYDSGCIIYCPYVDSKFNNLMNNCYFHTSYYSTLGTSELTFIPERGCLYLTTVHQNYPFYWTGGSIGSKTNYEFSVYALVKIPNKTTYMPVMLDSFWGGKDGFEVGFDDTDIIACCRKDTTVLTITYPMASAGVAKGDWIDLGASLSCVSGTVINLYVNGQNIISSNIGTTCSGYSSSATFHLLITKGSPYMNNTTSFYNSQGHITELTVFDSVLSDTQFSGISYNASGKLIARANMDYNIINSSSLPQSYYITDPEHPENTNYDGVNRAYSIYDYTSDYVYYFSNYTFIKLNILTFVVTCTNLRKDYNGSCDYNFETPTIKNCFIATNMNTVAGQSEYGVVYIGNNVFDDSTKYYDTGAFISPVIDVGETGLIAYNFEYSLVRDAYLEFYIRYANDKPVDFCHIYYVDSSSNFIEMSLATGKVFYTSSVSMPKSCDIYYDDTTIKITMDGAIYKNTDYTTPTNVFSLASYTLANITGTWFSYNGSYVLYYTSDKYLVGFPLALGLPCMRSSVTYSSVDYVSWSKYSQSIYVSVNEGVYIYNYMLGEIEYIANAYRVFYIYDGPVVIKSTDKTVLLNKDGAYYTYIVEDIDFSKNVEFDYVTEWIYYITLDGNLKKMRFIQASDGYIIEYLDTGITNVNDIYKITYNYVVLIVDARLTSYTKNGFVAVSDYQLPYINSGSVVFFDYNPTNKTAYYSLNYLSNNDLIWSDLLDWVSLGSKSSGFVVGKRYVQLKAVFKTSSNKNATPILNRAYFGSPVRVGPLMPHESKDFFVKLDVPLDDQGDIYSVKLITLAEDIVR